MKISVENNSQTVEVIPGARANFIHTEQITIAEWHFNEKVELPEHSHSNEQVTKVISGEFDLTINGEIYNLSAGCSIVIPPNAIHSGVSITSCHIIDIFHPVREDFKNYS